MSCNKIVDAMFWQLITTLRNTNCRYPICGHLICINFSLTDFEAICLSFIYFNRIQVSMAIKSCALLSMPWKYQWIHLRWASLSLASYHIVNNSFCQENIKFLFKMDTQCSVNKDCACIILQIQTMVLTQYVSK